MSTQVNKSFYKVVVKGGATCGFYAGDSPDEAIEAMREEGLRMGATSDEEAAFLAGELPLWVKAVPVTDFAEMAAERVATDDRLFSIAEFVDVRGPQSDEYYQWIATAPVDDILNYDRVA